MENSIRTHYHKGWRAEDKYLASAYQKDIEDYLHIEFGMTGSTSFHHIQPLKDACIPHQPPNFISYVAGAG
jgi:hypothetical protein